MVLWFGLTNSTGNGFSRGGRSRLRTSVHLYLYDCAGFLFFFYWNQTGLKAVQLKELSAASATGGLE